MVQRKKDSVISVTTKTRDAIIEGLPFVTVFQRLTLTSVKGLQRTIPHRHPEEYEFICCRRGRGLSFVCGSSIQSVRPGLVAFSRPGECHYLRQTTQKGYNAMVIRLRHPRRGQAVAGLSVAETGWLFKSLDEIPNHVFPFNEQAIRLFSRIFYILGKSDQPGSVQRTVSLRFMTLELLMELIACGKRKFSAAAGKSILAGIITEMNSHPEKDFPLDDIVRRTPWSRMKFVSLFRATTGLPPHSYLMALRIEKAKQILSTRRFPVEVVAHMLGYGSASHFISHFKMANGMTPSRWTP